MLGFTLELNLSRREKKQAQEKNLIPYFEILFASMWVSNFL